MAKTIVISSPGVGWSLVCPVYMIDPAKPGADLTVVVPYAGGYREVPSCVIADAAFNVKPEIVQPPPAPPDTDRMWDLLVLAARTSRYGE